MNMNWHWFTMVIPSAAVLGCGEGNTEDQDKVRQVYKSNMFWYIVQGTKMNYLWFYHNFCEFIFTRFIFLTPFDRDWIKSGLKKVRKSLKLDF